MKEIQAFPHRHIRIGLKIFKNNFINLLIITIASLVVVIATHPSSKELQVKSTQKDTKYSIACPYDKNNYYTDNPIDNEYKIKAKGLIVSHHLLAKNLIVSSLSKLDSNYQTIILVGPNHKDIGNIKIQTTQNVWKTDFGTVESDREIIDNLSNIVPISTDEDYISVEHSVCALVSFVKTHFPNAKIIPIILKSNTDTDQLDKLAKALADNCQSNCLFLASVDFSHDVPAEQARINDTKSAEILLNKQKNNINQIKADSLPSLYLMLSYLEKTDSNEAKLLAIKNSEDLSGIKQSTVTSYVSILYK